MTAPTPTRAFLASQVRWAMGRGLPPQVAEDVVFGSWEKAVARFDPKRGSFEAFMQKVVRTECAGWWRRQGRDRRAAIGLRLVGSEDSARTERAYRNQQALIDALEPEDRAVFSAWALQKQLGKGRVSAAQIAASIGLNAKDFENAKRRLRDHLNKALDRLGWSAADVLNGEIDVDRTG